MDTSVNKIYTKVRLFRPFPGRNSVAPALLKNPPTNPTNMLLEKMLHMSQPLAECKARLASIQSYRRQFLMVTKATVTSSKTVDFSFRGPLGFQARTVLLAVDSESPEQYAFESGGGNIDLRAWLVLPEVRPTWLDIGFGLTCDLQTRCFAGV